MAGYLSKWSKLLRGHWTARFEIRIPVLLLSANITSICHTAIMLLRNASDNTWTALSSARGGQNITVVFSCYGQTHMP